jgi:hypothetical protein
MFRAILSVIDWDFTYFCYLVIALHKKQIIIIRTNETLDPEV